MGDGLRSCGSALLMYVVWNLTLKTQKQGTADGGGKKKKLKNVSKLEGAYTD